MTRNRCFSCLIFGVFLTLPLCGDTVYVTSDASTTSEGSGTVTAHYDTGKGGSTSVPNPSAQTASVSPVLPGATSASLKVSNTGQFDSATANVSADLSTAMIQTSLTANETDANGSGELQDVLSFVNMNPSDTLVKLAFYQSGSAGASDNSNLSSSVSFGSAGFSLVLGGRGEPTELDHGWVSTSFLLDRGVFVSTGTYDLTPGSTVLPFDLMLANHVEAYAASNYNVWVGIQLADGVTYSSESGEFLSSPAPEPSVLAFCGFGLALLGSAMFRAKTRNQSAPGCPNCPY